MSRARRAFVLLLLGAVMVALAAIVLVRNETPDDELIASGLALAGLGLIIIGATNGGAGHE